MPSCCERTSYAAALKAWSPTLLGKNHMTQKLEQTTHLGPNVEQSEIAAYQSFSLLPTQEYSSDSSLSDLPRFHSWPPLSVHPGRVYPSDVGPIPDVTILHERSPFLVASPFPRNQIDVWLVFNCPCGWPTSSFSSFELAWLLYSWLTSSPLPLLSA